MMRSLPKTKHLPLLLMHKLMIFTRKIDREIYTMAQTQTIGLVFLLSLDLYTYSYAKIVEDKYLYP